MLQSMGLQAVGHELVTERTRGRQIVASGIPVCRRALVSMMENLLLIIIVYFFCFLLFIRPSPASGCLLPEGDHRPNHIATFSFLHLVNFQEIESVG